MENTNSAAKRHRKATATVAQGSRSAVDRYFAEHPSQGAVVAAHRSTDSTMITDADLNF